MDVIDTRMTRSMARSLQNATIPFKTIEVRIARNCHLDTIILRKRVHKPPVRRHTIDTRPKRPRSILVAAPRTQPRTQNRVTFVTSPVRGNRLFGSPSTSNDADRSISSVSSNGTDAQQSISSINRPLILAGGDQVQGGSVVLLSNGPSGDMNQMLSGSNNIGGSSVTVSQDISTINNIVNVNNGTDTQRSIGSNNDGDLHLDDQKIVSGSSAGTDQEILTINNPPNGVEDHSTPNSNGAFMNLQSFIDTLPVNIRKSKA